MGDGEAKQGQEAGPPTCDAGNQQSSAARRRQHAPFLRLIKALPLGRGIVLPVQLLATAAAAAVTILQLLLVCPLASICRGWLLLLLLLRCGPRTRAGALDGRPLRLLLRIPCCCRRCCGHHRRCRWLLLLLRLGAQGCQRGRPGGVCRHWRWACCPARLRRLLRARVPLRND